MSDRLYVGFASESPALPDVRVFERCETTLLGERAAVEVIGTSHRVSAPALAFHEVASCDQLEGGSVSEYPLRPGVDERITFRSRVVECETHVWTERGVAHPANPPDVAYVFEPDALTAISVGADGYETCHTYPEHDATVWTETRLTRL